MSDGALVRLAAWERRIRFLLVINGILLLSTLSIVVSSCRSAAAAPARPPVLTVSELDVVDPQGVIRARVGGDLPDAVIDGKRLPRGQKAAGVILYDDTGQERGGYITFTPGRQVALTLDNRGMGGMTGIFVADADAGSALKLMNGGDLVELRVGDQSGPSIHAVHAKQVAFHAPPVLNYEKTEACQEFRGALKSYTVAQVLEWCRQRTSEEACQACLSIK